MLQCNKVEFLKRNYKTRQKSITDNIVMNSKNATILRLYKVTQ